MPASFIRDLKQSCMATRRGCNHNVSLRSAGLDEEIYGFDRGHTPLGNVLDQSLVFDVHLGAVGAQVVDELVKLFRIGQVERVVER